MQVEFIDGIMFKNIIKNAANNLEANKKIVDDLNVFPVPDGDTGINMSLTIKYAADEIAKSSEDDLSKVAHIASSGALMGARGNSGVILSQLLRGFAKGCKGKSQLNIEDFALALKESSDMAYKAVMKPTEGTILTVAREISQFALENLENYTYIEDILFDVIEHGNKTLEKTPDMLPVLKEAGVVDAGGKGLIFLFEGAYEVVTGKKILNESHTENDVDKMFIDNIHSLEDITYGYCTEFIIISDKTNDNIEELKNNLLTIGDSVIVVGDEEKIKVHVHTDNPDKAINWALKIGSLTRIKIDNMREQVVQNSKINNIEEKNYGIISVSSGDGLKELFQNLGVDEIIVGGQTMNPCTQDFIDSINKINSNNIVVLPNNSNIILAANQAKEIVKDKNIIVIPAKTIPQGITALLSFSPEKTVDENIKNMTDALKYVKTGQVTFAVRDTQFNGKNINKNDIIGIIDGEIGCVGEDVFSVSKEVISKMVDDESELISMYSGSDLNQEQVLDFTNDMQEVYDEIDVESHYGGQPLYYFIISVE
ncbi:MAG: DAK2 domain-containing protein [Eubacteriaceae bacterium]